MRWKKEEEGVGGRWRRKMEEKEGRGRWRTMEEEEGGRRNRKKEEEYHPLSQYIFLSPSSVHRIPEVVI